MAALIQCHRLSKVYGQGPLAEKALQETSLALHRGETCVLLGPSGSGKTTLLSILGCLLAPSSGTLRIEDQQVDHGRPGALSTLRRGRIGFVFQQSQLLSFLTLEENIQIVGENAGLRTADLACRLDDLLERLEIAGLRKRKPDQVSGGQRQRAAIARALIHRPAVILADEPTAALDGRNGEAVIALLTEQAKRENALLVTVTHDVRLVKRFDRVFQMDSGSVCES
jgi:putative ABC transport system ATP-binding protein